jgi:hypothetical protein
VLFASQVMHMGTPVTSLSLSVTQDLLATSHINKRGVFLWSNQLMFGDPSAVATYTETPVPVHLPSIAAAAADDSEERQRKVTRGRMGQMKQHQRAGSESEGVESSSEEDDVSDSSEQRQLRTGREVRLLIDGGVMSDSSDDFYGGSSSDSGSSSSGEDGDSSSDEADAAAAAAGSSDDSGAAAGSGQQQRSSLKKRRRVQRAAAAARAAEAAAMEAAAYKQVDGTGAPAPLAPQLATLSLLPRSQVRGQLQQVTIVFLLHGAQDWMTQFYMGGENVTRRHIRHTSMALPTGMVLAETLRWGKPQPPSVV